MNAKFRVDLETLILIILLPFLIPIKGEEMLYETSLYRTLLNLYELKRKEMAPEQP